MTKKDYIEFAEILRRSMLQTEYSVIINIDKQPKCGKLYKIILECGECRVATYTRGIWNDPLTGTFIEYHSRIKKYTYIGKDKENE